MRRTAARPTLLLSSAVWLFLAGCHSAGVRFLSLIGLEKRPLSVAFVADQPTEAVAKALDPFPSYTPLQQALAADLGRPVAVDVCFPFQADSGLTSGWYDLAVVTPAQYAGLPRPEALNVLAIPVDRQKRAVRSAVLVVPVGSPVNTISELRGRVVAFGPAGDSRTHYAALQLLENAGLKPSDLSLEVLPMPGSLRHLPDVRAMAQAVIAGSAAAGFIDEAAWEAFPEHDVREGEPARDKLRIVGRTCALPDALVIASEKLDAATAGKIRAFLLTVGTESPAVLEPLAVSRYQAPTAEVLTACRSLAAIEKPSGPENKQPGKNPGGS